MNKFVLLSVVLLGFVSCKNGSGVLSVHEDITLMGKKDRKIHFAEGSHGVSINYKKRLFSKKITIELKTKGKKAVVVKIPKGVTIPKYNGTVKLSASQVGQPVDIIASVSTDSVTSPTQIRKDTCSVQRVYKQCVDDGQGGRTHVEKKASVQGRERVEFYERTTRKDISFELTKPSTDVIVATFNGGEIERDTVTTFRSKCRPTKRELEKFRAMAIRAKTCRK